MTNDSDAANDQAKPTEKPITEPVSKQLIDKPSDFRFHVAYMVYSDAWDRAPSPDAKQRLNETIIALSEDKIDYETFYRQVNQYRVQLGPEQSSDRGRAFIETQRKRDWRVREERASRNKRHGR